MEGLEGLSLERVCVESIRDPPKMSHYVAVEPIITVDFKLRINELQELLNSNINFGRQKSITLHSQQRYKTRWQKIFCPIHGFAKTQIQQIGLSIHPSIQLFRLPSRHLFCGIQGRQKVANPCFLAEFTLSTCRAERNYRMSTEDTIQSRQ